VPGSSRIIVAAFAVLATSTTAAQPPPARAAAHTKIVLLGTGTPGPTPDRSGPATAIVVNDTPYLVDFGPGVVRRASAAATSKGIAALQPVRLRIAFATHLHSDHTVGYPDLIFTPWTVGRREPRLNTEARRQFCRGERDHRSPMSTKALVRTLDDGGARTSETINVPALFSRAGVHQRVTQGDRSIADAGG